MEWKTVDLPTEKYPIKCPNTMTPIGITIHETDNRATAAEEITFMHRNDNEVSYHFAVDEKEIIQGLPLDRNGWHAGDGPNGTGNRKTIAIEICKNYKVDNLDDYYKARARAEELVGYLMHKYGFGGKDIYTHNHWNGKNCPRVILQENYLDTFIEKALVHKAKYSESVTPTPTPTPEVVKLKVGDTVKIKASAKAYATGEVIPTRYKGYVDVIQQVKADRVLLKSLVSWVYTKDVELVTSAPDPAPAPKPKPTGAIAKGDKVTYNGHVYKDSAGNGKGIKVSGTYTATIVNDNTYGVHLDSIGWAKKSDVKKVGATTTAPIKVGDKVSVVNNVQYNGGLFAVYREVYDVYEVKGDRVVIGNTERGKKVITAAINVINLRKV